MSPDQINENAARRILQAALDEGRAGELLDALFRGGAATIDAKTGQLVIISADLIAQFGADTP